jgi:hypothetical protein
MWLIFGVAVIAIFAVVGGSVAGGVYTIVLIPLAVIAFVAAVAYGYLTGGAQRAAEGGSRRSRPAPPPTAQQDSSPSAPSSPGELVDARRANQ